MDLGRDQTAFRRFAEKARTHFFDLTRMGETSSSDIIERLCRKLHPSDRLEWNFGRGTGLERRSLNEFGEWLCERASAYQNAYNIAAEQASGNGFGNSHHRPTTARAHHASFEPDRSEKPYKSRCYCCNEEHRVLACPTFKAMPNKEKIRFCIRRRLCLKCFGAKHSAKDCTFGKRCGVKDCPYEHHSILHEAENVPTVKGDSHHTSLSARADQMKVALGVIWTEAYATDGTVIPVSVMIDEGSDTTLFREDFLCRLKITGKKQKLDLVGVTGAERYDSQRADVRFRLPDGEETIIAGLTIPQVARPTPIVNWDELKKRWPHLADVPVMKSGGKIDVLLGLDHSHLIAVLESRVGRDDEPFASRTRLGWIVRGLLGGDIGPMTARSYNLTATSREEGPSVQESLDAEFRAFCKTENFGTEFRGEGLSESEQKAEKIVNEGLRKLDVG